MKSNTLLHRLILMRQLMRQRKLRLKLIHQATILDPPVRKNWCLTLLFHNSSGLSAEQILDEMPDPEMEDLKAALKYASPKLDHPIITA